MGFRLLMWINIHTQTHTHTHICICVCVYYTNKHFWVELTWTIYIYIIARIKCRSENHSYPIIQCNFTILPVRICSDLKHKTYPNKTHSGHYHDVRKLYFVIILKIFHIIVITSITTTTFIIAFQWIPMNTQAVISREISHTNERTSLL